MSRRYPSILTLLIFIFCSCTIPAQAQQASSAGRYGITKEQWVDSVYRSLNTEERIGQLFMVAAYSGGRDYNEPAIRKLLAAHQIGGLIFMQGGPVRQALLTNQYQSAAQVPLLIAMDAEWGLGMRLDSVVNLPRQMMLGAANDSQLVYQIGKAIAYQCKRLGVHINFAPVIDVNNNPANPVINVRSFGEDKTRVARLGIAYMNGLQANGVMACAKHFPGHGDTDADSHKDLPVINKTLAQLDTLELYTFRELIRAGVQSVMVAHLEIPALEQERNVPTTLSRNTITTLLKEKMGFRGIVFTDAMNMKGVTKYFDPGEADLRAFLAGNDMLLFSQDVPVAISRIKEALQQNRVTEQELERRVRKILAAKYDAGLAQWQPVQTSYLTRDLNQFTADLRGRTAAAAATLVRDENDLLAKLRNEASRVGYVGINATGTTPLYLELQQGANTASPRLLPKGSSAVETGRILNEMNTNALTVVAVHSLNIYPANNYGLDAVQMDFLGKVQNRKDVVIALMGNPYFLKNMCDVPAAVVGYEDDTLSQRAVADILLQRRTAVGTLPVTPCVSMPAGKPFTAPGIAVREQPRLPVTPLRLHKVFDPAEAGVVNPQALDKLNLFIQRCIVARAFPGCRILAAKDGKVFYNESFGYYTYDKEQPVTGATMYDVASLTKVLSTTLAVMRLYEQGRISLDKTLGDYFPGLKGTDKSGITVQSLLLHQAGLKSWIPFYKETLGPSGQWNPDIYRTARQQGFDRQVARNLFLKNDYADTIWKRINTWPLENKGRSVYSDLDFYYLAAIVEHVTNTSLDRYVHDQFYKPLGLQRICYNPLRTTDSSQIAPTENDLIFRRQLLQGYVHDQGAALLGGVAGHAGLFASANDVAVIFQMLMNYGAYNGVRYFRKETVEKFTAYGSALSRRGMGFDKPDPDPRNAVVASNHCSGYAFGHQGFTGTAAWADPATGVLFVILTNRVYPSAENQQINKLDVRTTAQDYIYESFGIPVNTGRSVIKQEQLRRR